MPGNTLDVGARPGPDRTRLAAAIRSSGTLQLAAEGIAAATEFTPLLVYVERRGKLYRWSPAHRGGPYPLMRVTARFLGIDLSALDDAQRSTRLAAVATDSFVNLGRQFAHKRILRSCP